MSKNKMLNRQEEIDELVERLSRLLASEKKSDRIPFTLDFLLQLAKRVNEREQPYELMSD